MHSTIGRQTIAITRVGLEFPSTYANIYLSTHAHSGGTIFTSILLTKETQVVFMWEGIFLSPHAHWNILSKKKKRTQNVFAQRG